MFQKIEFVLEPGQMQAIVSAIREPARANRLWIDRVCEISFSSVNYTGKILGMDTCGVSFEYISGAVTPYAPKYGTQMFAPAHAVRSLRVLSEVELAELVELLGQEPDAKEKYK